MLLFLLIGVVWCTTVLTKHGGIHVTHPVFGALLRTPEYNRLRHMTAFGNISIYDENMGLWFLTERLGGDMQEQVDAMLHNIACPAFCYLRGQFFGAEERDDAWFLEKGPIPSILERHGFAMPRSVPANVTMRNEAILRGFLLMSDALQIRSGGEYPKRWAVAILQMIHKETPIDMGIVGAVWRALDTHLLSETELRWFSDQRALSLLHGSTDKTIQTFLSKKDRFAPPKEFRGVNPYVNHEVFHLVRLTEVDESFRNMWNEELF